MKTITHVAIMYPEGVEYLPAPFRHHNIIRDHYERTGRVTRGEYPQGFLTAGGEFVGRAKAAEIAYRAGQTDEPKDILFSEDLW